MLRKPPSNSTAWRKLFYGIVGFEVVAFGVSYVSWKALNSSRERRYKLGQTLPFLLNTFYWFGEFTFRNNPTRKLDYQAWQAEGKAIP